jgi:hypothetical protein
MSLAFDWSLRSHERVFPSYRHDPQPPRMIPSSNRRFAACMARPSVKVTSASASERFAQARVHEHMAFDTLGSAHLR